MTIDRVIDDYYEEGCPGCGCSAQSPHDCPNPGSYNCPFSTQSHGEKIAYSGIYRAAQYHVSVAVHEGAPKPKLDRDKLLVPPKRDKRIRVGGTVRIKNPIRVVRCGYPLYLDKAITDFCETHQDALTEFLKTVGMPGPEPALENILFIDGSTSEKTIRERFSTSPSMVKILREFGYLWMKQQRFGGKERKLYTEDLDIGIVGCMGTVLDRKHVMTGTYYPPDGHYDMFHGEYDYEPGGLLNQQRNDIAWVQSWQIDQNRPSHIGEFGYWFRIEDLERVTRHEPMSERKAA